MSIASNFRRLVNLYKLFWVSDRLDALEDRLRAENARVETVNATMRTAVAEVQSQVRDESARIESRVTIVNQQHGDFARSVLTDAIPLKTKRLIVFLTPGYEWRVGGILSIAGIYEESVALRHLHRAEVVL